jgi:Amidohydrolase family
MRAQERHAEHRRHRRACTPRAIKVRSRHVADATGGHVGVETRVPILFTEGVSKRGMSLERFVAVTSTNAAKLLGLYPRKGVLAPGSDADVVVFDPTVRRTLRSKGLHGSDYSAWDGCEVRSWPSVEKVAHLGVHGVNAAGLRAEVTSVPAGGGAMSRAANARPGRGRWRTHRLGAGLCTGGRQWQAFVIDHDQLPGAVDVIGMNDQIDVQLACPPIAEFDHLAKLPRRVDVQEREWHSRRKEGLHRQMEHGGGVFASGVQHHRVARLRRRLAKDIDRLRLENVEVGQDRA